MKRINYKDNIITIYGAKFSKEGFLIRMDENVAKEVNQPTYDMNYYGVGVRFRFRTNSKILKVEADVKDNRVDWAMPITGSCGFDVFCGKDRISIVNPYNYGVKHFEKEIQLPGKMSTITIHAPRNEQILDLNFYIEDDAKIEKDKGYKYKKPIVFYGSSITMGGCSSSSSKCYTSLVSSWLDSDFINLGFSGNAHGEAAMAEYIKDLDMSCFVMDYDHNASSVKMLDDTHEKFFKIIRDANPCLPIIIMTKPDFNNGKEENIERRKIIKRTYDNAIKTGDKLVWFIDGETFFGKKDWSICTVEECHPNDLGFYRMAKKIYPLLKRILESQI